MHVYNRYYEQRILGEILTLYFTDFMITYKSDLIFIGKDKAKLSLWSIKRDAKKAYAQMEV